MSRSEEVRDFYERMPYPAPRTSLDDTATSTRTRTVAGPSSI